MFIFVFSIYVILAMAPVELRCYLHLMKQGKGILPGIATEIHPYFEKPDGVKAMIALVKLLFEAPLALKT